MTRLVLRLAINAAALWVAARFIDGIDLSGKVGDVLLAAFIFGAVNALIRPVVLLLSLPFLLLSLGLFTFVVNAAMLGLAAWLTPGLRVDGFGAAFLGSLVISLVSFALSLLLHRR